MYAMIPYYVMTTAGGPFDRTSSRKAYARMPPTEKVELREFVDQMVRQGSVATQGLMKGFLCDMSDALVSILADGRRADLGDLGSFSLSLKSEAAASAEEFSESNIKSVNIVFTPSRYLKERLATMKFKRISIQKKDHDAINNFLSQNENEK